MTEYCYEDSKYQQVGPRKQFLLGIRSNGTLDLKCPHKLQNDTKMTPCMQWYYQINATIIYCVPTSDTSI